jgi:hypothetical protein|uniref:Uncharacterized protein n=1 Tax=Podoviridae sp. ctz6O13 TaxID=2827757 RepID=A0A8S5TLB2_9CAUD|nr:MAG TPA: hypothetical protein [Podoviridae sp. ctz6O13]
MSGYLIERFDVIRTLLELACKASYVGVLVLSVGIFTVKQDDEGLVGPFKKGCKKFVLAAILFSILYLLIPSKGCMEKRSHKTDNRSVPETLRKSMESAAKQCLQNDSISTNEKRLRY